MTTLELVLLGALTFAVTVAVGMYWQWKDALRLLRHERELRVRAETLARFAVSVSGEGVSGVRLGAASPPVARKDRLRPVELEVSSEPWDSPKLRSVDDA